jgi:hypothetical protein
MTFKEAELDSCLQEENTDSDWEWWRNVERVSPGDEPGRVLREKKTLESRNPKSVSGMKQGRRAR